MGQQRYSVKRVNPPRVSKWTQFVHRLLSIVSSFSLVVLASGGLEVGLGASDMAAGVRLALLSSNLLLLSLLMTLGHIGCLPCLKSQLGFLTTFFGRGILSIFVGSNVVALTTSFENADACTGGDFFECKVASSSAALLAAGSASCVLGVVECIFSLPCCSMKETETEEEVSLESLLEQGQSERSTDEQHSTAATSKNN